MNPKSLEVQEIKLAGELNREILRMLELIEENLGRETFNPQTDAAHARGLQLNLREGLEHVRARIRKLSEELLDVRTHLWRLRYR